MSTGYRIAEQIPRECAGRFPPHATLVLDGMVNNAAEKQQAGEIAGLFSNKVVNSLQIRPAAAPPVGQPLDQQIKNAIREAGYTPRQSSRSDTWRKTAL